MVDPTELKTEVETNPAGIAGLSLAAQNRDIVDLLNAPNFTGRRPLNFRTVLKWAAKTGVLIRLQDTRDNFAANIGARSASAAALLMLLSPHTDQLDLDDPDIGQLLTVLVNQGVVTAAERTQLEGLASASISRAEVVWGAGTVVTLDDVRKMRSV